MTTEEIERGDARPSLLLYLNDMRFQQKTFALPQPGFGSGVSWYISQEAAR